MAIQTDPQRAAGTAQYQRENTALLASGLTKAELRAAYNALDQFLSDNATAINNALPVAARTGLTITQKALLLVRVIADRYLNGT